MAEDAIERAEEAAAVGCEHQRAAAGSERGKNPVHHRHVIFDVLDGVLQQHRVEGAGRRQRRRRGRVKLRRAQVRARVNQLLQLAHEERVGIGGAVLGARNEAEGDLPDAGAQLDTRCPRCGRTRLASHLVYRGARARRGESSEP